MQEILIPMRLIRNHDGCELNFTLFREPHVTQNKFLADVEWVQKDLEVLKEILEGD